MLRSCVLSLCLLAASVIRADQPRLIFHIDLNVSQLKGATVSNLLEQAAADGYNAILWEVEDKVRWENAPHAVDAFQKRSSVSCFGRRSRSGSSRFR